MNGHMQGVLTGNFGSRRDVRSARHTPRRGLNRVTSQDVMKRFLKKAIGLAAALVTIIAGYSGYKLVLVRRGVEQYRQAFGYQTPTTGLASCVCENPSWKGILVDSAVAYTDGAHNIRPFDIDEDGDLELVANSYRSDTLMVYKPAQDEAFWGEWARHIIDSRVGGGIPRHPSGGYIKNSLKRILAGEYLEGAHYTAIADLSGDGRPDLAVAGDKTRCDVVWYEAGGDAGTGMPQWTKNVAYRNDLHRTYHIETGDIDGDGDLDIVFTTKTDRSLGWLKNRGSRCVWPATIIDSNSIRCFCARAVDLDTDGKAEIIASEDDHAGRGGTLHLYTHSGDPGNADDWRRYDLARFAPGRGISVFAFRDMDRDGNPDVVAANHQGDVFALRNPGSEQIRGRWDTCLVTADCADQGCDFREIDVGDIDLDGDEDIIVADEMRNAVVWFENPGVAFCAGWRRHLVDQSDVYLRWCHCVRLGDVDKDGDLDVVVAAAASNVFLLYLNQKLPGHDVPIATAAFGD